MKEKKSRYREVIDGDREPVGSEKGYINLKIGHEKHNLAVIDQEKAEEIHRKGAEAVNKLHGDQKNAKQILDNVLSLLVDDEIINGSDVPPEMVRKLKKSQKDITLYELIQIVAAGRAAAGNMKAYELIRDTYGDKPVDKVEMTADVMTESDRAMLQKISARLQSPDLIIAVDQEAGETS